jgi:hypothetical protein
MVPICVPDRLNVSLSSGTTTDRSPKKKEVATNAVKQAQKIFFFERSSSGVLLEIFVISFALDCGLNCPT